MKYLVLKIKFKDGELLISDTMEVEKEATKKISQFPTKTLEEVREIVLHQLKQKIKILKNFKYVKSLSIPYENNSISVNPDEIKYITIIQG